MNQKGLKVSQPRQTERVGCETVLYAGLGLYKRREAEGIDRAFLSAEGTHRHER